MYVCVCVCVCFSSVSVIVTYILIHDFTPYYNYNWLAAFLSFRSDDCAHDMKLLEFIIWYFSGFILALL